MNKLKNFTLSFILISRKINAEPIFKLVFSFSVLNFRKNIFISKQKIIEWVLFKIISIFTASVYLCAVPLNQTCSEIKNKKVTISTKKKAIGSRMSRKLKIFSPFPKNCDFHRVFLVKKKIFLWELLNKVISIFPKNIMITPSYGEKTVDQNQVFENTIDLLSPKKYSLEGTDQSGIFSETIKKLSTHQDLTSNEHVVISFFSFFIKNLLFISIRLVYLSDLKKILMVSKIAHKVKKNLGKIFFFLKNFEKVTLSIEIDFKIFHFEKFKNVIKPYFTIFPSFNHRWGIFTLKKTKKLTILIEYRGDFFNKNYEDYLENFYKINNLDLFLFRLNSQSIVDATLRGNHSRLINHSCNPNCFTRVIYHGNKNSLIIISEKNIIENEELTYGYNLNIEELDYENFNCFCKELLCKNDLNQ